MDQNLILAIIQGITEFLPVSSSAHLIAASQFFGIQAPGQLLEVVLHLGTVLVVILAFHRSIWSMICGIIKGGLARRHGEKGRENPERNPLHHG